MIMRATAAGLLLTAFAVSTAHAAEPVRLSIASGLPKQHAVIGIVRDRFQAEVARRAEEAGAGQIVWDEMHAGTLTRMGGALEAVEDELSLIGIVSVDHEARRLPLQNLTFQMPFTTEECTIVGDAYQTVHKNVEGMTDGFGAARQTLLSGIASDGFNFISVRKIRNASEIRGVVVGTMNRIDGWISGVDGVAVRLPGDVLGARMGDGSVGAVLAPTSEIGRLSLKRYADHYTRTGFGAQVPYVLTVNTRQLKGLPEAIRAAILEAAGPFTIRAAQDYCEAGATALENLKAQGARTAKLLKTRRFQWADTLPPIAQRWARDNDKAGRPGSAAVAMFMEQLRVAGVTLTRDWSMPAPGNSLDGPAAKPDEVSQASTK